MSCERSQCIMILILTIVLIIGGRFYWAAEQRDSNGRAAIFDAPTFRDRIADAALVGLPRETVEKWTGNSELFCMHVWTYWSIDSG
ncbi:MAG: hypothetical protein AAF585_27340, partial [Verrucomicrobiota bacterium]